MIAAGSPLLFLNNQGLASVGGGVTLLRHLVTAFATERRVTVCSYDEPDPAIPALVRQITIPRLEPSQAWRFAPLARARHVSKAIPDEVLQQEPVIVAFDCHFAPLLAASKARTKIYVSLSCIPRQEWFGTPGLQAGLLRFIQYAYLERMAIKAAHRVIVSSHMHEAELRRFEALPNTPLTVIYPAIDILKPKQVAAEACGTVTLVGAGRMDGAKNYAAVIDLARRTRDLPCRYVLAGDGPELESLRLRARDAGVQDKVLFPGRVADIGGLLATADLFVHPSRYESFGLSVFEAMLAGVPPICADDAVAGFREFTHDGVDSCYVDFNRQADAAAAVRALIRDPERRTAMGAAARLSARRLITQDYVAQLREIVGGPAATDVAA